MNNLRPGKLTEIDEMHDERLSAIYHAAPDAEPPTWLDQRILTAAQTAAQSRPASTISWLRPRDFRFWAAPVALAATVVLATGLLRWLPPASELDGMPAPMEGKTVQSLAQPAAELDAAPAKNADAALAPPAAPSPPPSSAKPDERRLMRSRAMPEPARSESFQAAPVQRPANEEAKSLQQPADQRSPAAWRAEIAELRRQGRTAEAEARLAEFRRQYPDESLDEAEPPR